MGLLLIYSDLRLETKLPDNEQSEEWVRFVPVGATSRFCRFQQGERVHDFLQREMKELEELSPQCCANSILYSGMEIRLSSNAGSGNVCCPVSPLPERYRHLLGMSMDINRACKEDLILLPGIGASLADRILETREKMITFSSPEDLLSVHGIGKKLLKKIRRHVSVGP